MAYNSLIENHQVVQSFWDMVNRGVGSLEVVGPLVRKILLTGAWKERMVPGIEEPVRFDRFVDFITHKPLEGCGWSLGKVEALIRDDQDVLTMWQEAIVGRPGRPSENSDNITIKSQRGTSRADTLRRLRKDNPKLHARVIAGELSANAAAIEAGFRRKPTPFEQVRKLIPKLTQTERQQIKEEL